MLENIEIICINAWKLVVVIDVFLIKRSLWVNYNYWFSLIFSFSYDAAKF